MLVGDTTGDSDRRRVQIARGATRFRQAHLRARARRCRQEPEDAVPRDLLRQTAVRGGRYRLSRYAADEGDRRE